MKPTEIILENIGVQLTMAWVKLPMLVLSLMSSVSIKTYILTSKLRRMKSFPCNTTTVQPRFTRTPGRTKWFRIQELLHSRSIWLNWPVVSAILPAWPYAGCFGSGVRGNQIVELEIGFGLLSLVNFMSYHPLSLAGEFCVWVKIRSSIIILPQKGPTNGKNNRNSTILTGNEKCPIDYLSAFCII